MRCRAIWRKNKYFKMNWLIERFVFFKSYYSFLTFVNVSSLLISWLRRGNIKRETESLPIAGRNHTVRSMLEQK